MLDKVRQNLPPDLAAVAQDIYRVEAKLREDRPTDRYSDEEFIHFRIMSPNGEWLHEGDFSMPLYANKLSFDSQSIAVIPSYTNSAVRLSIEIEGRFPKIS
jgi:hypothetical protein